MLDDRSDLLVRRSVPERDRRVYRSCDESGIACQGDARRMAIAVNRPSGERPAGGYVETVDVAIAGYGKELLAIACPGEGMVVLRADFDWDVDEEVSVLAVIDPDGFPAPSGGRDETSTG